MSLGLSARHRSGRRRRRRSARFLLDGAVAGQVGRSFPWGTLAVNISGAFLLGALVGADARRRRAAPGRDRAPRRPSPRSARGRWRATASARTASCGSASRTSLVSLVLGVSAAWLGRQARGGAVNDDCLKLTVYYGERDRAGGGFLADALVDVFARHELQTSLVMRGIGRLRRQAAPAHRPAADASPRTCRSSRSPSTPANASRPRSPTSTRCAFDGLVTLERARMLHGPARPPSSCPATSTRPTKLTVYVGRQERAGGTARLRGRRRPAAPPRRRRRHGAARRRRHRPRRPPSAHASSAATPTSR